MDNNNNQPLVQPVQQPQIPPVDPQMGQPVQQPVYQQPVQQQPVQQPVYQPLQPDPNQPAYMYQPPYQPQTQYVQGNNATLGIQQADLYTPAEQSDSESSRLIFILLQNSLREERKLISFVSFPWSASLHLKSLPVYFPESLKASMTCHPTVHLNRSLMFHQRSFSQPMSLHGY